jgi:hypothetical protein
MGLGLLALALLARRRAALSRDVSTDADRLSRTSFL